MSRKRRSLKVRAELYAQKHADKLVASADSEYTIDRTILENAWRDGYLQARRDARKQG